MHSVPRTALVAIVLIVLAGMAGRFYVSYRVYSPASSRPMKLSGDEVVYVLLSERLLKTGAYHARGFSDIPGLSGGVEDYLEAPLFKHPPLYPLLVGVARRLLPGQPIAPFLPNIFLSGVSLVAMVFLARALGMSWGQATAACALLAVSPTHWTASSRIWLEMTWMTVALVAVGCTVRALDDDRWSLLAAVWWTFGWLTKYTTIVAWLGCLAGVAWVSPRVLLTRRALLSNAMVLAAFTPWLVWRASIEGMDVLLFWTSPVQDWRVFGRALLWLSPIAALAIGMLLVRRQLPSARRVLVTAPGWIVALTCLAVLALAPVTLGGGVLDLFREPWSGWNANLLAESAATFHFARPILFEPVLACVLPALFIVKGRGWHVVRSTWLVLFLFLTAWGNFQSRYTLPLIPLGLLLSVAVIWPPTLAGQCRGLTRPLLWGGAAAALVLSVARSIWLIGTMALEQDYFYF